MRTEAGDSLLRHRIVIVSGKGGTGKTTVSAALALAASQRGLRVLVCEVGPQEHLPRLLAPGGPPVGYAGRELLPGLRAMRIEPFAAVAEYLGLQLGSERLVRFALQNRALRQLLEGAPGWRELITLGKIWHLEQMRDAAGAPLHDLIVVDAPATGHGVTFLDVPRVVHSAVQAGPLARNAALVEALIRDPERTLLLPVSLAEELPAEESRELVTRMRDDIGIAMDRIVVNAIAAVPDGLVDAPGGSADRLTARLASLPEQAGLSVLPAPSVICECVRHLVARAALNHHYVAVIAERTGLPVVPLPFLARGVDHPDALAELARSLIAEPRTDGASLDDRPGESTREVGRR